MPFITSLRRAFAANPHKVPVRGSEQAKLEARGIQDPALQTYFAWRRSLMLFVVVASVLSAALATYREYTETEEHEDLMDTVAEYFAFDAGMDEEEVEEEAEPLVGSGVAGSAAAAKGVPPKPEEPAPVEHDEEPKTAFAKFTEAVELMALYALPVAAAAVVLFWTRFQLSFGVMLAAFAFSFLVPMLIALCPWSWWGYVEPNVSQHTQPLEYWKLKIEGLLEGAAYLVTLLPTVLSLVPGVQRACIRVKLLLPQSMLPGFFLTAASPFYALFLLVIFVAVNQFDTHPLFFVGMLLFLAAPLSYVLWSDLFTRPLISDGDYRRVRMVQRIVGLLTALAGGLIVAYLTTREFRGVHLLGLDYEKSLLVPLDVVEFVLEVLSRSMFITVLGADLFMRMNLTAWKNSQEFRGSAEAESYHRTMGEFAKVS